MSDPKFVNRRGQKYKVEGEPESIVQAPAITETVSSEMPEPVVRKSFNYRKLAGIITAVLGLIVLVYVVVGEVVAAQYHGADSQVSERLDAIVKEAVMPQQSKGSVVASDLDEPISKLGEVRGSLCRGGLWDNLAPLYPRAHQAMRDCNANRQSLTALTAGLQNIQAEMKYVEGVAHAFKPVLSKESDGQFAVIGAQLDNWKQVRSSMEDMSSPESLSGAHEQLVNHVRAIYDGWSMLNSATNDRDGTQYKEAQNALGDKYTGLQKIATEITEQTAVSQADLSEAYKAASQTQ